MIDVQTNSITASFEWKPDANTVSYLKLDWNATDSSSHWYVWTSTNVSYETSWNLTYAKLNGSSANGFFITSQNIPIPLTFNLRIRPSSTWWIYNPRLLDNTNSNDNAVQIDMQNSDKQLYISWVWTTWIYLTTDVRQNLQITIDSSWNYVICINWVMKKSWSGARTNVANWMIIWYKKSNSSDYFGWKLSRIIIQNEIRSISQWLDYFGKTKSKYWLT